ncbi:hypothetical protein HDV62DRAFT_199100 [Trichoderma sp. SZMC 28011]
MVFFQFCVLKHATPTVYARFGITFFLCRMLLVQLMLGVDGLMCQVRLHGGGAVLVKYPWPVILNSPSSSPRTAKAIRHI